MRFGFVGGMYQSPSPLADNEALINWRPQKVEAPNARSPFILLPTSGLLLYATLKAGLPSTRGSITAAGRTFWIAGTHLFETSGAGIVIDYGDSSTANNNIIDDGLPATMVVGGTQGSKTVVGPLNISNAVITSPTTAQITVPTNANITPGATAAVAGIINPNFLQLNGNWAVASIAGPNLVNLTTVGLTVQPATALTAGTLTTTSVTPGGYPSQLLIASGGTLSVFSLITNSFQPLTTPPANVLMVDFLRGFFCALSAGNVWSVSAVEDATTWPGESVSQVSVFSDQLVSLKECNDLIWIHGASHAVAYYNSGAPIFPFDVASGGVLSMGSLAQFSIAQVQTKQYGKTLAWLGGDDSGAGVVYMLNGFTPIRVSDSGLEYWLSLHNISDAVGMERQEEGQNFYDLWFPSANVTWTLDVDLGLWHQRSSLVKGLQSAHLSRTHTYNGSQHLVGDRNSGNVYALSSQFFTDNGSPIIRTRQGPTISIEGGQLTVPINEFQVDFETGQGPQPPLVDATGLPRDPVAMFSYSEDYGKTWGNERVIACGRAGQFRKVAIDRRLGSWRSWTPRVTVSDPIAWRIADAYVNSTQNSK